MSATQTIDEESLPPLSSARTGRSERSLRCTALAKTVRKCSSYSASRRYRIHFGKDGAKVFLVFCVEAIPDSLMRIKIPVLADRVLTRPQKNVGGWWNGIDADAGSQMDSWIHNR